ncbi:MAG: DegV family protein [Clostridia bacterium]
MEKKEIAFTCDSACDLTPEIITKYNIFIVPFTVMLGEQEKKDGVNVDFNGIYDYVSKTGVLPKTSAVSIFEYQEFFCKILETHKNIMHFSISAELSSSNSNANCACKEMNAQNICIVNSKSLSSGIALQLLECIDKFNQGATFEELCQLSKELPERTSASFVIKNVKYLYKGGRCSSLAMLGANVLKIKPRISVINGSMSVTKKYLGKMDDIIKKYVLEVVNEFNPDKKRVFVTSSSPMTETSTVKLELEKMGFQQIYCAQASCTICCHCGPETFGILFLNK